MSDPKTSRTHERYVAIYSKFAQGRSVHQLKDEFDCHAATIRRAIAYCLKQGLTLTPTEDLQVVLRQKQRRLVTVQERLKYYQKGIAWTETREALAPGGEIVSLESSGRKVYPSAEGMLYSEIRQLEDGILTLKGIIDADGQPKDIVDGSEGDADRDALEVIETLEGRGQNRVV